MLAHLIPPLGADQLARYKLPAVLTEADDRKPVEDAGFQGPVPFVTAASIKLWNNHACPLATGVEDEFSNKIRGEIAMKSTLSALVALSLIAGVAGSANAFEAKAFYEQLDRDHN